MSISIELIYRFPWLPSLEKFYSEIASKPPSEFFSEVLSTENAEEICERVFNMFKAAFQNLEEISDYKIDSLNVYLYLILKIMLYLLDNKQITNRIANLYSKQNFKEFIKDIDKMKLENLYEILKDLKLDCPYSETPWDYGKKILRDQHEIFKTQFKIHYIDYLTLAIYLKDDYRKLVNNAMIDGYIFIEERRLARLLQEYVRNKLIDSQKGDKIDVEALKKELMKIQRFKDLYEQILNDWAVIEEKFDYSFEIDFEKIDDISNMYPPCVLEILKKANEGQNLIHNERLFIVWFLIALDYPVDKIVNIFSTMPDFNKERTEYQVKYAKKKSYTPYKCSSLKSFTLCYAEKFKDELCLGGYGAKDPKERKKLAHPLGYVRIKQYRESKNKKFEINKKDG